MPVSLPDSVMLRELSTEDYAAAVALWASTPGVVLREDDTHEAMARYLERNPGLSFVALDGEMLVGAVLCGEDGRRGYLQHLAVAPAHRGRGIGRSLVASCLEGLRRRGISRCHLFVVLDNEAGAEFWRSGGWRQREDLLLFSRDTGAG